MPLLGTRRRRAARTFDEALSAHRSGVLAAHRVRNSADLRKMVDDLGFCFAFTLRAGDAAIPACFDHLATESIDRKWSWVWKWKDDLAESKKVYYGTLLARKPTFASISILPAFYATFGRAGEEDDHLDDVRAGRLSDIARRIIEFLAQNGETQTKRMRTQLGISSQEGKREYGKAIDDVQRLMYVSRVRAVGEGREDYNYTYDLFVRRYPESVRAAERISSAEARATLVRRALDLAGAATERQLTRLFEWHEEDTRRVIARLEAEGHVARHGSGRDTQIILPSLAPVA